MPGRTRGDASGPGRMLAETMTYTGSLAGRIGECVIAKQETIATATINARSGTCPQGNLMLIQQNMFSTLSYPALRLTLILTRRSRRSVPSLGETMRFDDHSAPSFEIKTADELLGCTSPACCQATRLSYPTIYRILGSERNLLLWVQRWRLCRQDGLRNGSSVSSGPEMTFNGQGQ